jgi:NitT/TauT family transport system substrate-binding protein
MQASKRRLTTLLCASALLLMAGCGSKPEPAPAPPPVAKKSFNICWTIYVGWMPWDYAASSGIMKKWADKYGIEVKVTQLNDYVESINQYTAGKFDGCTMTNMDALTIPAAGGVDSTALIVGDYSNGNDGITLKGKKALKDIKGQKVNLVELSVSHYVLARGLESAGLSEKDVTIVNTSDADIVAAATSADVTALVSWKPQLAAINAQPGMTEVFNSSKIPGEVLDLLIVNSKTLQENPELGKALVGAWYEVMALVAAKDPKALEAMARASGTDLAGFQDQLATTFLFTTPAEAVAFTGSAEFPVAMKRVADFSFAHGLFGEGAKSVDAIGIEYAGGKTQGDATRIKLRFPLEYMQMAADGKL